MDRLKQAFEALPERGGRQSAWDHFARAGWPSTKQEGWRNVSVKPLQSFSRLASEGTAAARVAFEAKVTALEKDFDVLAFFNGRAMATSASMALNDWSSEEATWNDGVEALQDAFAQSSKTLTWNSTRPLALVFWQSGTEMWSPQKLRIQFAKGSSAQVFEYWHIDNAALASARVRVEIEAGAQIEWARCLDGAADSHQMSSFEYTLKRDALLRITAAETGPAWTRYRLKVSLVEPGAEAWFQGVSLTGGDQTTGQAIEVRHEAPQTNSHQLFKSLIKDQARNVFASRIYIAPKAQKVDSSMTHHNLLLSEKAQADTQPELEIFADDVKAAHGATIGRLEEERLFYLRSRGLSRTTAVRLLAEAFLNDVLMKVRSPLLSRHLRSELTNRLTPFIESFVSEEART